MSIGISDELESKAKNGKIASARQVFLDGDKENLQQIGEKTNQLVGAFESMTPNGGASKADVVSYKNTTSGMTAVTAQGAIDELAAKNKSQDATIATKAEKAEVTSQMQTEQTRVNNELAKKFNSENIAQESGDAEDKVMSQKAVSTKLSDLMGTTIKLSSNIAPLSNFFFLGTGGAADLVLSLSDEVYTLLVKNIFYNVYVDGKMKTEQIENKTYTCSVLSQPGDWLLLLYNYVEKVFYVTNYGNAIQENVIALAQFRTSGNNTTCTYLARGLSAITFNNKVYEKIWSIPDVAQNVGGSENNVMSQKAFSENVNALANDFFLALNAEIILRKDNNNYLLSINNSVFYVTYANGSTKSFNLKNGTDIECTILKNPAAWVVLTYNYKTQTYYVSDYNDAIKENTIALAQFEKRKDKYICTYLARGLEKITFNSQVYEKLWSIPELPKTISENVFFVGKGLEHETITSAYNAAVKVSSKDNPCTIIINPGIYKEYINLLGDKYISFIGVNKQDVIWRYDDANYNHAPLRIAGQCYVANITFISTADDYVSDVDNAKGWEAFKRDSLNGHIHGEHPKWLGRMGAYAVHCDDDHTDKSSLEVSTFENCIMYSKTSPAFGSGVWPSSKIVLKDCDLFSDYDEELYDKFTTILKGALYAHGLQANISHGQFGECYEVKNCKIESNFSAVVVTEKINSNADDLKYKFYNNIAISNSNKTKVVVNSGTKMDVSSFGNNTEDLNYKEL